MTTKDAQPPTEQSTPQIEYTRWLSQLRADMAESLGGTLLRGARAVPIGSAAGATKRPRTTAGALIGWSVRETAGAAATVVLRDGCDANGDVVAEISLAANGAQTIWLGPAGVNVSQGLYVDLVAGAVEGAAYLRGND